MIIISIVLTFEHMFDILLLNIWTYVHNMKESMCNLEEERSDEILLKTILKSASNPVVYVGISLKE